MNHSYINPLLPPDAVKTLSELATSPLMSPGLRSLAMCTLTRKHPNREPFHGVLCTVDTPSDSAPSGAMGHRVILASSGAKSAAKSLVGMGVDCTPDLAGHNARVKVGVIEHAKVLHGRIEIRGYLYARDFPEIVANVATERMGMSWEITDTAIADPSAEVWTITRCIFTGAAILRNAKAAYRDSWIELGGNVN